MLHAQELVEEGKVKYIGLSEFAPADVRRAHAIHPITALEMVRSEFLLITLLCGWHASRIDGNGVTRSHQGLP